MFNLRWLTDRPAKYRSQIEKRYDRRAWNLSLGGESLEDRHLLAMFAVLNLGDEPVSSPAEAPGSLRQAIFDANAAPGPDVITFAAGNTIRLTAGELCITDDLTISAAAEITIDGGGKSRIFFVDSATAAVTLEGLRLTGGSSAGGGGAIHSNSTSELRIVSSRLENNTVRPGTDDMAGAIFAAGDVRLIDSEISDNQASLESPDANSAGAILALGDVTLMGSVISDNETSGGSTAGAIFASGDVTLMDSIISGNRTSAEFSYARSEAAGAVFAAGDITLVDCIISGNRASAAVDYISGPMSGGVFALGALDASASIVENNFSRVSSGRSTGGIHASGPVIITESHVTGNRAREGPFDEDIPWSGTAIYSDADVSISDSTISGNSAGGVGARGDIDVRYSNVSQNWKRRTSSRGGGISALGDVMVQASQISFNGVEGFGGLSAGGGISGRNVTVSESVISGNFAGADDSPTGDRYGSGAGGGIFAEQMVRVIDSTMADNRASARFGTIASGGAIYGGHVIVTASTVSGNSANRLAGGIDAASAVITSSLVSDNDGGESGGVYAREGDLTIVNSTLSGNTSVDSDGLQDGSTVKFSGENFTIDASTITKNASSASILARGVASITITNSIVADNDVERDLDVEQDVTPIIRHSIIGNNTGLGYDEAPVGSPDANGNVIGDPNGLGVIDPLLAPLADNGGRSESHAPLAGSPALDAGEPAAMPSLFDQRGSPYLRVVGGTIDIGAHEGQATAGHADFDDDGQYACADVDALARQMLVGDDAVTFDLNNDGETNNDDLDLWLSIAGGVNLLSANPYLPGDANLDGIVGAADLNIVGQNWRQPVVGWCSGDFVVDGTVDAKDLNELGKHWRPIAVITVNTLVDEQDGDIDDGDVSLRDAILAATPGATIDFDITLSGGAIELGLGQLSIPHALNIDASALPERLTIDAADRSNVFSIDDGNSETNSLVTINGLVLRGGRFGGEKGGAIVSSESVTVHNIVISGNAAGIHSTRDVVVTSSSISDNASPLSKAAVSGENVSIADSIVSQNVAKSGGVAAVRDVAISSSEIVGNSWTGDGGGGVRAWGDVVVADSDISNNQGAGVSGSNVTITGTTVTGNSNELDAFGSTGEGGGIFSRAATIINSTVSDNSAGRGGGIYVLRGLILEASIVSGNSANRHGGGVYARGASVISSTVSDNSAAADGGGIYSLRELSLESSAVSNNSANRNGGGVYTRGTSVNSSTVSDNSAADGGGIYNLGDVLVESSTVSGNLANAGRGGGLLVRYGTAAILSSTVSNNTAREDGGGVFTSRNLTVASSTVSGNRTSRMGSLLGSGISAEDLAIFNSIVAANNNTQSPDIVVSGDLNLFHSLIGNSRGLGLTEAPVGSPDENGNLIGLADGGGIIDPLLAPLDMNGGPTETQALLPGSPAIDMGEPDFIGPPEYDQRGAPFARISGGRIDMGAYEAQPIPAAQRRPPRAPLADHVHAATVPADHSFAALLARWESARHDVNRDYPSPGISSDTFALDLSHRYAVSARSHKQFAAHEKDECPQIERLVDSVLDEW